MAEREETEMELSLPDFGKVQMMYQYSDGDIPKDFQRIFLAGKMSLCSLKSNAAV